MASRIALLVHGTLERDPRVSRHARAAQQAGYRVAVLTVSPPGAAALPRWGAAVEGVLVYESRVVGRTLLGRLRQIVVRLRRPRSPQTKDAQAADGARLAAPSSVASGGRVTARGGWRDLFTIAQLLRNNVGVYRQFRGIGAALVHANDLNVLLAGYLLARSWRVPLLYDSHELWTQLDEPWSPLLRRLFRLVEGALIRGAAAVVTVNGPIADRLAELYGISRPDVVMNCPEVPVLAQPGGSAAGPLRVIYQGMLNPHRGLHEAIDAVAGVPGVDLAIRGPGALRDALQRQVDALGVGDRVTILPPVPMSDLVSALDGFDVGLVPYQPVGMNNILCSPNKLFEYMAAGLAVVCSDLPVLREVVAQAEVGLLYDPRSSGQLIEVLQRLAGDRDLLTRLRANAARAAFTRFNAEHEEARLLRLYDRLIRANGRLEGQARVEGKVR